MKEYIMNNNGKNVDEYFSQNKFNYIGKLFLKDKVNINLSNKDYLEVLPSDLSEKEFIFNFENIEILIFKDISEEGFQESIGTISNCKTVFIRENISKLLIYSKTKNIDTIRIYETLDDVYDAIFVFK